MHPKNISIKNYTYHLPEDRIAKYPLLERDLSKLLVYKGGEIVEDIYRNVANHIPANTLLIFNNTKVIHARLFFNNAQGAKIEIFCLEPAGDYEMTSAMSAKGTAKWHCMIGRANKWKEKVLHFKHAEFGLTAELIDRTSDAFTVEFKWQPADLTFAEILDRTGMMPIPPYLRRESDSTDETRYQTVYALNEGSVAAPTAGLHFTSQIFESLKAKKIDTDFVTLHVGAGTFKPVKAEKMEDHEMHAELIDVSVSTLNNIIAHLNDKVVAVGTTALRTVESLYWMGVKAQLNPGATVAELEVNQWDAYDLQSSLSAKQALETLLGWMEKNEAERIICKTRILIAPDYRLKVAKGLITNFHQPDSTLLLLVAAVTGDDWRKIYDYALAHNFRFLSYGDGSLIWAKQDA